MKKTEELFNYWNKDKQNIEFNWNAYKRVKVWEIWVAKIWVNIWWELSKDGWFFRPVLVVSNFMWWDLIWVIPITTQYNSNYKEFLLKIDNYNNYWLDRESYLCLNQFRTISIKRLSNRLNWFYRWKYHKKILRKSFINIVLDKVFDLNKKSTPR